MCSNIQDDWKHENFKKSKSAPGSGPRDDVISWLSTCDEAELHFLFQGFFGLWETKEKDKREFLR